MTRPALTVTHTTTEQARSNIVSTDQERVDAVIARYKRSIARAEVIRDFDLDLIAEAGKKNRILTEPGVSD